MASEQPTDAEEKKKLCAAVAQYGPYTVTGLEEGTVKKWCTCGLSKKQPWCDSSHKGTGFKSLKWTVPKTQSKYQICGCKQTKSPPLCDGSHIHCPLVVKERQEACTDKEKHCAETKLCTGCGWIPDF